MKNRTYGYARVSTKEQFVENQITHLIDHGVDERDIFSDVYSGNQRYLEREAFNILLQKLIEGDVVVIYSIDRLSRRFKEIIEIVELFESKKVKLMVTTLNLDLTNSFGRLILHQMSALAEFELSLMKERQSMGIERAKKAGKYKGRQSKIGELTISYVHQMYNSGQSLTAIASTLKLSKSTIHNIVKGRPVYQKRNLDYEKLDF